MRTAGYIINRVKFEQFLAEQAVKHGAKILLSTKAIAVQADRGMPWVETPAGEINADFIIGADSPY